MVQVLVKVKSFLNECSKKAKQHQKILLWITFAVAVALILIALSRIFDFVMTYPELQVSQYGINNVTEKAVLVNQYRTTLIQLLATFAQILGGGAVAIGIYFAWGNLTTTRDGQITERFTRAVDQLGNEKIEIRLGGIYALERISNESKKDFWPIMEILTAYVRKNSSVEVVENKKVMHLAMHIQSNESTIREVPEERKILLDIQAVLKVIGRRKNSFKDEEVNFLDILDLKMTYLKEAFLWDAHLEKADLTKAHLEKAYLGDAHLERAFLSEAHLERAVLGEAHLEKANLRKAYLEDAVLWWAHFEEADLREAHLEDAIILYAHLEKADLRKAHLEGAHLGEAHLEGAHLGEAHLEGAHLGGAHLERANLEGAHLERADLEGAHLERAINLTVEQLSEVKTLYNAKLDEELRESLKNKYPDLYDHLIEKPK